MPIQSLSDETSRILTSTQTLSNATSVIKELVENALDARASSISIEIAANMLDRIIVKDDGFGIGVQDRLLLCKRGYTSKITDLDDLAKLGGTFLGFRGTALASIAELSKEVTIITKVDGEQPATTMTFGPGGELLTAGSASHNDGTTVRVEKFLISIPVRRQLVLKNPSKVLDEIKKLLQGFALARPAVKLSLKVLKAKSDKWNWSFAGCKDGNLMSAAVQVVGKSIASLCQYHTLEPNESEIEDYGYSIQGFLLDVKHNDVAKAGSVGQYFSVDGRSVTQEKGIMKQMVKSYKAHLSHAATATDAMPSNPFLIIHINCPEETYDVNVEPAKNVVLFHNEDKVLDLVEKLFTKFYGAIKQQELIKTKLPKTNQKNTSNESFNILLARKTPQSAATGAKPDLNQDQDGVNNVSLTKKSLIEGFAAAVNGTQPHVDPAPTKVQSDQQNAFPALKAYRDMHSFDDEDELDTVTARSLDHALSHEERYNPDDIQINNPFVRAKAYSLQRPRDSTGENQTTQRIVDQHSSSGNTLSSSPTINAPSASHRISLGLLHHPPTPDKSPQSRRPEPYQNPGPPSPRRTRYVQDDDDDGAIPNLSDLEQSRKTPWSKQSVLVGWAQTPSSNDGRHFRKASEIMSADNQIGPSDLQSIVTTQDEIHRNNVQRPSKPATKPFRSPLKSRRAQPSTSESEAVGFTIQQLPTPGLDSPRSHARLEDDLKYILDFEYRKKAFNQQRRSNKAILDPADLARIQKHSNAGSENWSSIIVNSESASIAIDTNVTPAAHSTSIVSTSEESMKRRNPHQNRYLAAIRRLEPPIESGIATSNDLDLGSLDRIANVNTSIQVDTGELPSMPASDPRSYLIYHHHLNSDPNASTLKTKRLKSSQLPLESILPDVVNHDVLATPTEDFPQSQNLHARVKLLLRCDKYVITGKVEPLVWSPAGIEVTKWQNNLQDLVRRKYRAKGFLDDKATEEPEARPTISINLVTALKAYIDSD